ncbi:MAG: methionyl-tRNA formyltransferase [Pseudomonadota bacterium]
MRLIFMGSPDFSVPTLDALLSVGHDVVCVYTQPPKPAGRGKKLRPTPVHAYAESRGLPVRTPKSLKSAEEQADFAALEADAAIVIAYGLILPQPILDAPRHGAMNLHGSRLPRWRGAAPIQRAIMAGDTRTGIDAMVMEAGLDTGPVLVSETCRIFPFDTAGDLHDRLASLAADLAPRALAGWVDGSIRPVPQPEDGVTYASKITAADQRIDWSRPAREIDCQIRGLSPSPGAWFEWTPPGETEPLRVKALMSALSEVEQGSAAGEVMDDTLSVACGEGAVQIRRLQRPGRGPMDAADFLRGSPIAPGTRLN